MAVNDDVSLFEEIDKELKDDRRYAYLKKHKDKIFLGFSIAIIAIIAYSSWYTQRKHKLETITTALVDILHNPGNPKAAGMIESLAEGAPAEIKPLMIVLKAGRNIQASQAVKENAEDLLALSKMKGVDVVWKDLATLILASHNLIAQERIYGTLEELSADNRPFRFMAIELLGFLCLNNKQQEKAMTYFQKIVDNKEAPKTQKERISMIMNHVRNQTKG